MTLYLLLVQSHCTVERYTEETVHNVNTNVPKCLNACVAIILNHNECKKKEREKKLVSITYYTLLKKGGRKKKL